MHINELDTGKKTVYAVGDIHGMFNTLAYMIKRYDIKDSVIICCGDCGLGFSKPEGEKNNMSKLNKIAKENSDIVVMVRGNHDDPKFFNEGLSNTKYIIAVPDYTVVDGKILCVGGATSIDRTSRMDKKELYVRHYQKYHPGCSLTEASEKTNNLYWADEAPVYDEDAMGMLKEKGILVKHVITHTCPSFCEPQTKDGIEWWINRDPGLIQTLENERHVMDQLFDRLATDGHPIETWTYGHYHWHCAQNVNNIKFTMLGAVLSEWDNPDWIEITDRNIEQDGNN